MANYNAILDSVLTLALIILAIILIYLAIKLVLTSKSRLQKRQETTDGKLQETGKKENPRLARIREQTRKQMMELDNQIKHLKTVKNQLRKEYMKGEISAQTFAELDKQNEYQIVDAQTRLDAIKDASGK